MLSYMPQVYGDVAINPFHTVIASLIHLFQ